MKPIIERKPGQRGPLSQSPKQKAKARQVMLEMRKKFPDKFNPKKNGATANFKKKAAERRVIREAQKPPELNLPGGTPAPAPTLSAPPAAPAPAPAPSPAVTLPAAGPKIIEVPQDDLFSPASVQAPPPGSPPPAQETAQEAPPGPGPAQPGPNQPPPPGAPAPEPQKTDPGVNRALAMMVWGMVVQMCVMVFGEAMMPQKFVTPAGVIDENENIILAWCEYFNSLGFVKLSPLWNLLLVIAAYFLVRMNHLITWFQNRRSAKKAKSPEAEPLRSAASPSTETPPAQEKPAPAPAPAKTPPPPPPPGQEVEPEENETSYQ